MFCGPTGVGKTALCKTLSKTFFGTEAEVVLCRESTQSFCLNVSGHDDQIRHERVHGEAHSASAFLVREAIFVNKVCWWYVCDVSLAAHGKVSKLIGAPPGYVWILVFRSPFWRNPNEFLSFTSLECEENAFFYLLVWNMVWSLHILYHYSLFNMKSFYTMFFFPSSFQNFSWFRFFSSYVYIHFLRWATTMVAP